MTFLQAQYCVERCRLNIDMCRVCGCPITRPICRPTHLLYQIREGNLKTHGHHMMHSGQKQCSVGKRCTVAIFMTRVQSVAVWCTDDRKNHPDFYRNRGLFFHYFGIITKVDNLLMVTNNNLGKFYGLKCLFWWPKVEAFWIYSVTLCNVLGLKNQLWW